MRNIENEREVIRETNLHPLPEQLLLRQAIKESLTTKQRYVWDLYNYDALTQEEIAAKLGVSRPAVTQQIGTIERKLTKYCKERKRFIKTVREATK